jgi:hypothetical protein
MSPGEIGSNYPYQQDIVRYGNMEMDAAIPLNQLGQCVITFIKVEELPHITL